MRVHFTSQDAVDLYTELKECCPLSLEGLQRRLVRMAVEKGRSENEAEGMASTVLQVVQEYESVRDCWDGVIRGKPADDVERACHPLFQNLNTMLLKDRIDYLDELNFGLRCVAEDSLFKQIQSAEDRKQCDSLYKEYRKTQGELQYTLEEEFRQKTELISWAKRTQLAPELLRRVLPSMEYRKDPVRRASDFAGGSYQMKCLAAMTYLLKFPQEDIPLEELILAGCVGEDFRELQDAVARGILTKKQAEKTMFGILAAVGAGLSLASTLWLVSNGGGAGLAFSLLTVPSILCIALSFVEITDGLAEDKGMASVRTSGSAMDAKHVVKDNIQMAADFIRQRKTPDRTSGQERRNRPEHLSRRPQNPSSAPTVEEAPAPA